MYQTKESCTEREGDYPAAARAPPPPAGHLHPAVAPQGAGPPACLQRALQPSAGVLPLVKQGVLVAVLHTGETNVLLFNDGVL